MNQASVSELDIVNYCYKMLRILEKKYETKFPHLLIDKSELESFLLVRITQVVIRFRKNKIDGRWQKYCKVAIQNGIRDFLNNEKKKHRLHRRLYDIYRYR